MEEFEETIKQYLEEVTKDLIENISEKILDNLQDHIYNDMYQEDNKIYIPSKSGRPSEQFLNAFELSQLRKEGKKFVKELLYNTDKMETWNETYSYVTDDGEERELIVGIHQTASGRDLRNALFNILRKRERFDNKPKVDFWEKFLSDVQKNFNGWVKGYLDDKGISAEVYGNLDLSEFSASSINPEDIF